MNWRKGFTLIELLIVVTILAILAGAAVPYVQDYVEDAKFTRAKTDLDEVKNAIAVYETKRNEAFMLDTYFASIVAKGNNSDDDLIFAEPATDLAKYGYLLRVPLDPWGQPYYVEVGSGAVRCAGPDGDLYSSDDITTNYQPGMALRGAYWIDANGTNLVDSNDQLMLRFSRPLKSVAGVGALADLLNDMTVSDMTQATDIYGVANTDYVGKEVYFNLQNTGYAWNLRPGRSSVTILDGTTGPLVGLVAPNFAKPQEDTQRILVR
jgi:general secretion pathway protein G